MIQLQQGEEILWQSRTHAVLLTLRLLAGLLVAAVMGFSTYLGANNGHGAGQRAITWGVAVGIVVFAGAFAFFYLRWRSLAYFVTNFRLIRSEGIVGKKVTTLGLDRVQDVTYTLSIPGRLLKFGTLVVESAGATGRLCFEFTPSPIVAANKILTAAREARGASVTQCSRCGKKLDPTWNLCPFCGLEISPLGIPTA